MNRSYIEPNQQGGMEDHNPQALERARKADLITFPKGIQGTNCGNCIYFKKSDPRYGFCTHPKLQQVVNNRMCCNLWDEPGTLRAWERY